MISTRMEIYLCILNTEERKGQTRESPVPFVTEPWIIQNLLEN